MVYPSGAKNWTARKLAPSMPAPKPWMKLLSTKQTIVRASLTATFPLGDSQDELLLLI